MERVFDIGTRREVFWDDYLVDLRYTTAERILHHPVRKEVVMKCSEAWEGDCCYFFNVLKDDDRYRMYYEARNTPEIYAEETPDADRNLFRLCYAESQDGLHWVKPSLGICTFDGSTDNNIIWDADKDDWHDPTAWGESIFVMKDTNPACPPEERYKGIHGVFRHNNKKVTEHTLKCLVSADGIHFRFGWYIYAHDRFFDSLNTVLYDETEGKYICYFRGWHTSGDLENNAGISAAKDSTRDIRSRRILKTGATQRSLSLEKTPRIFICISIMSRNIRERRIFWSASPPAIPRGQSGRTIMISFAEERTGLTG